MEHAVCENPPCPKGLPSFRDQQCQTHDRLSSKKKGLLTAVVLDGKGSGHTSSRGPLPPFLRTHTPSRKTRGARCPPPRPPPPAAQSTHQATPVLRPESALDPLPEQ